MTPTPSRDARGFSFVLRPSAQGLSLVAEHRPELSPLVVDWGSAEQRRRIAGGKRQLLARAIGLHKYPALHILDATAGFGRDAFTLAMLGAQVDLVERQPLLLAMLHDVLQRARTDPALCVGAARMQVLDGDALAVLRSGQHWDVVHLDPMYPEPSGRALPQKHMQMLRELTGGDADADSLLAAALAVSGRRVVVKRPSHARFMAERRPDFQLRGTQARYDIYLPTPATPHTA